MVRVMLQLREREIVVVSRSRQRLDSLKGKEALVGERCRGRACHSQTGQRIQAGAEEVGCTQAVITGTDMDAADEATDEEVNRVSETKGEILLFLTDGLTALRRKSLLELADWAVYDKVAIAAPKYEEENRVIREMGLP